MLVLDSQCADEGLRCPAATTRHSKRSSCATTTRPCGLGTCHAPHRKGAEAQRARDRCSNHYLFRLHVSSSPRLETDPFPPTGLSAEVVRPLPRNSGGVRGVLGCWRLTWHNQSPTPTKRTP